MKSSLLVAFLALSLAGCLYQDSESPDERLWKLQESNDRDESSSAVLIELFTSEGCSSCPPADDWLGELTDHPGLWVDFVPVARHVDYWDYLGWKDPFASPENTARQRALAKREGMRSIYTPGFFVDGKEWKKWYDQEAPKGVTRHPGALSIDVDESRVSVRLDDAASGAEGLKAHIATLGSGLAVDVRKGENRGKRLRHNFVLLSESVVDLSEVSNAWVATSEIPTGEQTAQRYALGIWVTDDTGDILYATGQWLDEESGD